MNELTEMNQKITMTLKEITDLLDIQHSKAMVVVLKLSENKDFGTVDKTDTVYNSQGQTVETYVLNKRQAQAVAAKLNVSLLMRVIDRLEELESQQPQLPQTKLEWMQLAVEQEQLLITQSEEIRVMKPKIKVLESLSKSEGSVTFTNAAKAIGVKPRWMTKSLEENGVLYRSHKTLLATQKYLNAGYFEQATFEVNESMRMQTRVTAKGITWISEKLL